MLLQKKTNHMVLLIHISKIKVGAIQQVDSVDNRTERNKIWILLNLSTLVQPHRDSELSVLAS